MYFKNPPFLFNFVLGQSFTQNHLPLVDVCFPYTDTVKCWVLRSFETLLSSVFLYTFQLKGWLRTKFCPCLAITFYEVSWPDNLRVNSAVKMLRRLFYTFFTLNDKVEMQCCHSQRITWLFMGKTPNFWQPFFEVHFSLEFILVWALNFFLLSVFYIRTGKKNVS